MPRTISRPLIGITLDWQEKGTFSRLPHYALREHYFACIHAAGGLPVAIPHNAKAIPDYLSLVDGLLVPGGDFGLLAKWYIDPNEPKPYAASPRLEFDMAVIKGALAREIPLLTVCAGMQIMGGMMGCKLTANINNYCNTSIEHHQEARRGEYVHPVNLVPGTQLKKIVRAGESFGVNTCHREAIVQVPKNGKVVVNAVAPDGIIEGIELPDYKFALGLQWHPEFFYEDDNPHLRIFKALVKEAKGRGNRLIS
ncbi:MAG: gamma-glutamyl-gamma-aminobutyrate hydrolase family protein [Rickettsiales bacterium]|jgi:putative glutamine amidotransferase|nr:gamma-glutamyl-gamma-aminobutyrate hydrolase family protein [Rickettsiales bacterium]